MTGAVRSGKVSASPALAAFARVPRSGDLALAGVVLASVAAMVVRLPPAVLDVFIAFNLAVAIALLLVALYVDEARRLTALPSLLLLSTLFRLAINVSTTRLVLLDGSAGRVVEAFGRVVVGGNVVVGGVVFLVLTLVQFIVVAKGSERVAEVAARFTLDALPGKQMSIDADLRAGSATLEEAQGRRRELERESQLYGALDGAMKFVKGDAVAGLVITAVNIAGGLAVGVLQRGMGLAEAAAHYTVLTIGDGLASQIPALLISVTAGLVVTRVPGEGRSTNLALDIGAQALAQPRSLAVAAGMLGLLALMPGLPALPFLALSAAAAAASAARPGGPARAARPASERADDHDLLVLRNAAPVHVLLGPGVPAEPGAWAEPLRRVRVRLYERLGVRAPEIVVAASPAAGERAFAFAIAGAGAGSGVLPPGDGWVLAEPGSLAPLGIAGAPCVGGDRRPRVWADARSVVRAAEAGYATGSPPEFVAEELERALAAEAAEFVGVQEARELADALEATHPALVQEVVPRLVSFAQVAEVLRRLVREGVSIRDLRSVYEALAIAAPYERDAASLSEAVRGHLRRQITEQAAGGRGSLSVYLLAPEAEMAFREAVAAGRGLDWVPLDPATAVAVVEALRALEDSPRPPGARQAAVVVPSDIRRAVRAVTETALPHVPVFAYQELLPALALHPAGTIGAATAPAARGGP